MKKFTRFLYCLCAGAIIGIVVEKQRKRNNSLLKIKANMYLLVHTKRFLKDH